MASPVITTAPLKFLRSLEANNSREWFNAHKPEFKRHEASLKAFFSEVLENLRRHDEIDKMKMFRIYRDVRFSKDKSPYKTHLACSFSRAGARLRGGYYIQIKPGGSFIATGFWNPNKEDLMRIRKELELDATEFRGIIDEPSFKKLWGTLEGEAIKTAPKGFDKEHPNIDLIKRKQFIFVCNFTDTQVTDEGFAQEVDASFKAIRPYFDLMSDVLTTNLNGESILD